ncbi:hypothetical protein B0E33_15650 [Roseibium algicola]|uniref:Uncharacterized protein n=1 Tax=Roseibium algicola TaxID=2857014 RepID=A0ABM6I374_9HYPH|nr:hypothetical protein [Roseibium aggregatum]AQQ04821.1 hypothetical protein B0E33_15650 [Roseibium aggregatum]
MVSSLDQRAANRERSNARWVIDFRLSGHPVCVPLNAGSLTLLLPVLQVSLVKETSSLQEISNTGFYPSETMDKGSPRKPSNCFGIYFFF